MKSELAIIRRDAARMNDPEVVREISRIDAAIGMAGNDGLRHRLGRERSILAARLHEIRGTPESEEQP